MGLGLKGLIGLSQRDLSTVLQFTVASSKSVKRQELSEMAEYYCRIVTLVYAGRITRRAKSDECIANRRIYGDQLRI
jgi:hypothetical protein